ncbi:MAG: UDP-2,4-diacetamido-2,4,6-trideoxy-beta-L-altropyranose hydrolase [Rhizomicrobium sp.]
MRFLFRTDASTEIGSGHVVRCASLAQALSRAGHEVQFACRALAGDLNSWLEAEGVRVNRMAAESAIAVAELADAAATAKIAQRRRYDWLIVDHYGLGIAWEQAMADAADRVFVIDDLGRRHACQLLLDQNYGNPAHALYPGRVPPQCELLLGAKFALLRPEFSALRAASLGRHRMDVSRVLVFLGGSDPSNETCRVLDGIGRSNKPNLAVDVVIGSGNPHRQAVENACAALRAATLHVQTGQMAQLMVRADCAIGAAGTASWERCALGLPALVAILAENQTPVAEALHAAGAHRSLGRQSDIAADDYAQALMVLDSATLARMSSVAAAICDGKGAERVTARLAARRSDESRLVRTPNG